MLTCIMNKLKQMIKMYVNVKILRFILYVNIQVKVTSAFNNSV